jgi:aminopeptidase-like protein
MELLDNINRLLGDDIKQTLKPGVRLKIAASCFSMYAYEALKAELMYLGAEKLKGSNQSTDKAIIRCGDHKISISTVAPNFGTEVTQEMVGTRINTRKGYQTVRIS